MINPEKSIKLAIADDHQLFLQGLHRLLSDHPDISVIWVAEDGEATLKAIDNDAPDVLLLDLQMQKLDGIGVLEHLRQQALRPKVIVLSMHVDRSYIQEVHRLGAHGYLLKNAGKDELLHAIKIVAGGGKHFAAEVTDVLLQPDTGQGPVQLTKRELEVLTLIAQEYSNPDIAEKLFLSTETVNSHRKNLLRKLEVKNTAGLVRYAIQHKLV